MGERRVRNAEVGSSILLGSTNFPLEYSHIPSPVSSKGCSVFIRYNPVPNRNIVRPEALYGDGQTMGQSTLSNQIIGETAVSPII